MGEVRERVMERIQGRERGSLHCYVEYELTCQHILLVLSVDIKYNTFAHVPLAKHSKSYGEAQSKWARDSDSFP